MDRAYLQGLVSKISLHNDEGAARELFNLFHPKLVRFAVFYTSTVHDANDIVSEVFIKLFKRLKKVSDIQDIQYYLYKSVKNQCLTHLKKQRKDISLDDFDLDNTLYNYEIVNPETELISNELAIKIEEAINNLPPKRKMIYKMVVIDGMKYRETAEILDISIKTVENHLSLAVKDLRKEIMGYLRSNDVNISALHAYFKKNG